MKETTEQTTRTTLGVWELFGMPLRSYILKRVSEPAEAEDILQEVFLRVHKRLHTLRDEKRLPAWLYTIARNAITDHYRNRQSFDSLREIVAAYDGRAETDAAENLAARMHYFVNACLPQEYARALLMADLEGRTQGEVARALGLSLSGAKTRVQRARRMLREAFLRCCYFEFDGRKRVIDYGPRNGRACVCESKKASTEIPANTRE